MVKTLKENYKPKLLINIIKSLLKVSKLNSEPHKDDNPPDPNSFPSSDVRLV
jgi:hypothetical protein